MYPNPRTLPTLDMDGSAKACFLGSPLLNMFRPTKPNMLQHANNSEDTLLVCLVCCHHPKALKPNWFTKLMRPLCFCHPPTMNRTKRSQRHNTFQQSRRPYLDGLESGNRQLGSLSRCLARPRNLNTRNMAMGQNRVPPVNIPIPTRID